MKKPLILPKFKNDDAERAFWAKINLADYYEPGDAQHVYFPNLKPSSQPISFRLPKFQIVRLKEKANSLSVPYQSLVKLAIDKYLFSI